MDGNEGELSATEKCKKLKDGGSSDDELQEVEDLSEEINSFEAINLKCRKCSHSSKYIKH